MALQRRPSRGRRWLRAGLLSAWAAAAVAVWWPSSGDQAQPLPRQSAAVAAALPAPLVPASPATPPMPPMPQEPDAAALPQLRIPAGAAGRDPLVAALEAARQSPAAPPPPEIAAAKTLEQAFAAMQAAQAETAVPARTSPFAAR